MDATFYIHLMNCSRLGYIVHDRSTIYSFSEVAQEFYGEIPMDFEAFAELIHEDDRESMRAAMDVVEIVEPGTAYRYYARNNQGAVFHHRGVRDASGLFHETIQEDFSSSPVVYTNLLERLHSIEGRYESLVANVPGAVFCCRIDRDWTMECLSPHIQDLIGYPASDFLDNTVRSFSSVIHPADQDRLWNEALESSRTLTPLYTQYRVLHSDGSIRWLTESSRPSIENGTIRFRGVLVDISVMKRSLALMDAILEAVEDGILVVSNNAKILHWNPCFANLWKVPLEILQEGDDWKLVEYMRSKLSFSEAFWRQVNADYADENARSQGFVCLDDGRVFERRSVPCCCEGENIGQVITYRDVTNRLSILFPGVDFSGLRQAGLNQAIARFQALP